MGSALAALRRYFMLRLMTGCARPTLALLLAAGIIALGPMANSARAELVSTATMMASQDAEAARERVAAMLAREDVRNQLQDLGVGPDEAQARIASLSDREIVQLDSQLSALPAGKDFLALVASILIVTVLALLISDIMGWTDVFSFVRAHPRNGAKSRSR